MLGSSSLPCPFGAPLKQIRQSGIQGMERISERVWLCDQRELKER